MLSNPFGSRPDCSPSLDIDGLCRRGAPSPTRGRVCHMSASLSLCHIFTLTVMYMVCAICTARLSVQDLPGNAVRVFRSMYGNGSLLSVSRTVVGLTAAKYFVCLASPCHMLRTFWFSCFCMTSACCLHNILINRKHTEFLKPHASCGPLGKIANCAVCFENKTYEQLVSKGVCFQKV